MERGFACFVSRRAAPPTGRADRPARGHACELDARFVLSPAKAMGRAQGFLFAPRSLRSRWSVASPAHGCFLAPIKPLFPLIPAQAGIHGPIFSTGPLAKLSTMDPCLRRGLRNVIFSTKTATRRTSGVLTEGSHQPAKRHSSVRLAHGEQAKSSDDASDTPNVMPLFRGGFRCA